MPQMHRVVHRETDDDNSRDRLCHPEVPAVVYPGCPEHPPHDEDDCRHRHERDDHVSSSENEHDERHGEADGKPQEQVLNQSVLDLHPRPADARGERVCLEDRLHPLWRFSCPRVLEVFNHLEAFVGSGISEREDHTRPQLDHRPLHLSLLLVERNDVAHCRPLIQREIHVVLREKPNVQRDELCLGDHRRLPRVGEVPTIHVVVVLEHARDDARYLSVLLDEFPVLARRHRARQFPHLLASLHEEPL
mmetsp:Transcript_7273/g.17509  ORF Transcript_7273/g.17509 Transcript_7273/m.17509 type:complete len:248 (-) Transcript_7273:2527-3270(-)